VKPEEMKLAGLVIATFDAELNLGLSDEQSRPAQDRRRQDRGRGNRGARNAGPPKVVDLMEALRRSLNTVSDKKKRARPPSRSLVKAGLLRRRQREEAQSQVARL
jgi:non-homologous end joining protein Ku